MSIATIEKPAFNTSAVAPSARSRPAGRAERGRAITVAQFGLGPIGIEALRLAAAKPWARVVGGVDIDPAKVGMDLGELSGDPALAGSRVYPSFEALLAEVRPDVVLHTAGSKAIPSMQQIAPMAMAGISVVSSCEELLFPYHRAPAEAREFNALCERHDARVVGTGVNPGFVMDVLPVCLTGVSRSVREIHVERVVNASTRRMPLQRKIGSGLEPDAFRELFQAGKAGHAGFQESVALVAHSMGWKLERIVETCEPVVADHDITTAHFQVRRGLTCGLHQQAEAILVDRSKTLKMDLKMYLDAADPHDAIRIEGDPPIHARLPGGVAGDSATVAALINAIPRLLKSPAGLRLMTELPVPSIANPR
jgi:4-hydroxy-tetrahydrodipicolinate reductase